MKINKLIRKVYSIKGSGQKIVTIPKDSNINNGDYVEIKKVNVKVIVK